MADALDDATDGLSVVHDRRPAVTLADKYDLETSTIFVSGAQAIVRLLLMQGAADRRAGLDTAGFVSGYRGSPLGGLDLNFLRAKASLTAANVTFEPGLNEDLAATAIWGAQQAEMRGEGRYDGVFGLWYGKGPGVDRSGDAFRHANLAGTSRHGGVLALMGDDHTAESSSTAHQSEFAFVDVMMPILSPAGVQEILDYGLYGFAMSRYSGTWTALKCIKDTIESTASIEAAADRVTIALPDRPLPVGGLNIRPNDSILDQEVRLHTHKQEAVLAFLRANGLNRIVFGAGRPATIGIVTAGKSYLDVRQALGQLGFDAAMLEAGGVRLLKLACPWPLEPEIVTRFAAGLDTILVVEEKRALIEPQLRDLLYAAPNRPQIIGKRDAEGRPLLATTGALDANDIAVALGRLLLTHAPSERLTTRLAALEAAQRALRGAADVATRAPYFCSGCPHNTSTKVPDGMRAYAGIGCHFMVLPMERNTEGYTHMGGEGANWIGEAPFSTRAHVFQNLGDGTYNHSGVLALRWAVAAKVNITYKILFNDAVAMTGGQTHEGGLTVDAIARQVAAEGVREIAVVTDEPDKYAADIDWPAGLEVHGRDVLDDVQRSLAAVPGTTVLIYDQTCAAEKRRRRKRNIAPDPDKRAFINARVCEGCGDCGTVSNCVSVQPLETEFGRKRTIDQSSCNKDFSCVSGFCPSFVTVEGAMLRKADPIDVRSEVAALPRPALPVLGAQPFGILVAGVGGTGVVTAGAVLGMAAHLEGKGCGLIDMAGMAQKGGAVFSHVKIAAQPGGVHAIRIAAHEADLVLGCDLTVTATKKVLASIRRDETAVIVNSAELYPGDFTRNPDFRLPVERIRWAIRGAAGTAGMFVDATATVRALLGDPIAANMFLLGFAWQLGRVPLEEASILRAIALNGEAVALNHAAFAWGRRAAVEPEAVQALVASRQLPAASATVAPTHDGRRARYVAELTAYQNAAYAARFTARIERVAAREAVVAPGQSDLSGAVADNLFKLMAAKDEYEVARLYTDGTFVRDLRATFEGKLRLTFHFAPPMIGRQNASKQPVKVRFGGWMLHLLRVLARGKVLRGTPFDPFGYTRDRRDERRLLADYEATLDEIVTRLTPQNYDVAVALALLPEKIRGFGHVKARSIADAEVDHAALLARLDTVATPILQAAE